MVTIRVKPQETTQIKRLLERFNSAIGDLDFIQKISIYGSLAKKKHDKYSDLDLKISVSDFGELSKNIYKILGKVGKFYVVFPVKNQPGDAVLTVLWKDFPLYQKFDLSVVGKANSKIGTLALTFNEDFWTFYDFFIGATRYVKHRKRGEEVSAYKFYRSSLESLIKLFYSDIPAKRFTSKALTIKHFRQIDEGKFSKETKITKRYLYTSGKKQMDKLFIDLLEQYHNVSLKEHLIAKRSPESKFASDVIKFTLNELK